MKKEYPPFIILLDTTLEVLRENHPDEVKTKEVVGEVEIRNNPLFDDPIFKDAEYLGHTGTVSEVFSVIDHLIEIGEIDDSHRGFGGGLKISGVGIKKLDLGGTKKNTIVINPISICRFILKRSSGNLLFLFSDGYMIVSFHCHR